MKKRAIYIKKEGLLLNTWKHRSLLLLALPAMTFLLLFNYIPMAGVVLAFKRYNYVDGIFGSPWVGIENFKVLRNTIGYFAWFLIVNTVCNITFAVLLDESRHKRFSKVSHTISIMPSFIGYVAVNLIAYCFLDPSNGLINRFLIDIGYERINFYSEPQYWPLIATIIKIWIGTGMGCVFYVSAISGIDQELYESAAIDGAKRLQRIRYITLPHLIPIMCLTTLLALGGIMTSDTGIFYQVTRNSPQLYETTQTIDVYVMNALMSGSGEFSYSAAVSFFQSTVGCACMVFVNLIVKKISPENSLF